MKYVLALSFVLISAGASARDLRLDEAMQLKESGRIQAFDALNQLALEHHPNGTIRDTELEEKSGRYVYQLEVVDAQGQEWEMELDATTGEILTHRQDDD